MIQRARTAAAAASAARANMEYQFNQTVGPPIDAAAGAGPAERRAASR